jgi:uncharacterized protein YbjQ (UPF0145 family)
MESERLYKEAYKIHYMGKQYDEALALYQKVIEQYPDSQEAKYSQNQIENINNMSKVEREKNLHKDENISDLIQNVVLTTAPSLEGYAVSETLKIVTSECVFRMNIFKDFLASITDLVGGRSAASQKVLKDAREICLTELRKEAFSIGANAVIAINLNYNEFSGGGKSMLFLVASGTAVKVEKITATKKDQIENQSQAGIPNVVITHEEKR